MYSKVIIVIVLIALFASCSKQCNSTSPPTDDAYLVTKTIEHNGVSFDVVIDKPEGSEFDVLIVYHGTVLYDSLILQAANTTLDHYKNILDRNDMLIISVAYPEENLLFGDNISHAEAALLWVKNSASQDLGLTIKKVFLSGHSQGGYLVTRLNAMHSTNGVIANAPGPLDLVYRCQLEETGQIQNGITCTLLANTYGATTTNPDAYFQRSLLNFTNGFKSDILFVQGLADGFIHMHSWPTFKQQVEVCSDCAETLFLELDNLGHPALFMSSEAKDEFNSFINNR